MATHLPPRSGPGTTGTAGVADAGVGVVVEGFRGNAAFRIAKLLPGKHEPLPNRAPSPQSISGYCLPEQVAVLFQLARSPGKRFVKNELS